jgi:hypothetical protein
VNLLQRTHGGNYTFRARVTVDGVSKEKWISTGTNILSLAKMEAGRLMQQLREARRTKRWTTLGVLKLRANLPTLDALRDCYEARIAREAVRCPTAEARRRYFYNLRAVVARARGIECKAAGALSVGVLAGAAGDAIVRAFRECWLAGVDQEDLLAVASRRRSGDSMLRQARACFGTEAMRCYSEMTMPDLGPFMSCPGFDGQVRQHVSIGADVLARMDRAAGKLRVENPRMWIAHVLHKFCGLRTAEVAAARIGWLQPVQWTDQGPVQWMLEVSQRLGYDPKASEGTVPVCREVARALVACWRELGVDPQARADEFMIPAMSATARKDLVSYEHADWLRAFLPRGDFAGAGYELRRWAFRAIFLKYGSREAARAFLRHAMPADAARHYQAKFFPWSSLGDDLGITLADARGGLASIEARPAASAWDELG